ncbi:MAG: DUF4430 domain-containing protein [Lachnospiraceae bacterium]|nr:DUF4430 domain-containing protein [Lachnospiraceae bacterium]
MKEKIWKKLIWVACVIGVLVFSFWYGGDAPGLQGFSVSDKNNVESRIGVNGEAGINETDSSIDSDTVSASSNGVEDDSVTQAEEKTNIFQQIIMNVKLKSKASDSAKQSQNGKQAQKNANKVAEKESKKTIAEEKKSSKKKSKSQKTEKKTKEDNTQNTNSESDKDVTTETKQSEDKIQCTVYISCATVLDNMERLPAAKKSMIPKDGVVLEETTIWVAKDASVFDVLQQITKEKKIHLEYTYTPAFKSYYIEGIYNLYEFDCGDASGWMYSVNGEFPEGSSSYYTIKDGDVIRWLYSCQLGKDIGRYFEE